MARQQRRCETEKAIENITQVLLKLPKLYTHIYASDLRGNYLNSALLRMLSLQYRVGIGILSLNLLNPFLFSWILKR